MPASALVHALRGWYRVALVALAAIAATETAMYVVRRDAAEWVVRTREVLRVARESRAAASDRASAAHGALTGGEAAERRLPPLLDSLVMLTADDPTQQARARAARDAVAALVREPAAAAPARLARERLATVIAVEERLFGARTRRLRRIELGSLLLLLAELAVVAWVLGRFRRGVESQASALGEQQHRLEEQATELEATAEELSAHAEELEAANAELSAFSYAVAHDLRAPLRSMDGYAHLLLADYADRPLDDDAAGYLRRVRRNAQRMGQMIDGLLALARLGRGEVRRERVDLGALAADAVADLRRMEPRRRVAVTIAPGLVTAGDPRLLAVVMQNLVGNAWKFTGARDDAVIEIGATRGGDGRRAYFVRDNGAGFDMAYAEKLFGTFQRLHDEASFSGTGIGLATVRRIVERHGGRVWAEGAVDRGATVYFSLGPHDPNDTDDPSRARDDA